MPIGPPDRIDSGPPDGAMDGPMNGPKDGPVMLAILGNGGHGGSPTGDGESAMQGHMTNTRNTPIESLEHAYPLEVVSFRIRRGSGGRGRAKGGDGIERRVRLLADARITVIAERRKRGPYGLAGGEPGTPGATQLTESDRIRTMPGKFTVDAKAGTVVTLSSPGGGGAGKKKR